MSDFNERFSPSLFHHLLAGLANGAQSQWDQAKWAAGGMNGQQPPFYTGGPTYPLQAQDLQSYAARQWPGFNPFAAPIFPQSAQQDAQPDQAAQPQQAAPSLGGLLAAIGLK